MPLGVPGGDFSLTLSIASSIGGSGLTEFVSMRKQSILMPLFLWLPLWKVEEDERYIYEARHLNVAF